MKTYFRLLFVLALSILFAQCKKEIVTVEQIDSQNTIRHAKGFSIQNYEGYTVLTVRNPWPKATKTYTYILKEKN